VTAYSLDGKAALVTGAGRGIGLAVARRLHDRGAAIALVDLDGEATERAAQQVGEGAIGIGADITDRDAIGQAVATAVERFGGLDVCVANAGIVGSAATMRAGDPATFERVIEVDLFGTTRTIAAAMPHVVERRGQISIVSSVYAIFNGVLVSPYAASKAGVEALGRALRIELAPHGVSVGVAYYGFVATEMVRAAVEADALATRLEREKIPRFARRRITPEQAAAALVKGIEQRSPRVYAPGWLRAYSALRGVLNPLLDRRFAGDPTLRELLAEADVPGRKAGRETVAAPAHDQPVHPASR
jgi:NAD(P)-dependent dehydrogenase (short-subunit alcohol dehydrogenase family)